MKPKNPYHEHSKLSAGKFRQLARFFAMDLSATDVARLTGLTRKTVTVLFLKMRKRIAHDCERNSPLADTLGINKCGGEDLSPKDKCGRGVTGATLVVGVFKRDGKFYTELIPEGMAATLRAMIHGRIAPQAVLHSDGWRGYDALIDIAHAKHFRVSLVAEQSAKRKQSLNGTESFWSFTKRRLHKFNGVPAHTAYLHLKECEWRFNLRHRDVYAELLRLLRAQPL